LRSRGYGQGGNKRSGGQCDALDHAYRIEVLGVDVVTGLLSELDELPESLTTTVPEVFRLIVGRARDRGRLVRTAGPVPRGLSVGGNHLRGMPLTPTWVSVKISAVGR
jgi:hypothetical protein